MRSRAKTFAAVVGITALAVVGIDAGTYAGTGDSLILGKFNKANKATHITSTGNGPALSLHARGTRPALAVDSNTKIVRLNADRLDGREATSLQNNVRVYKATEGTSVDGVMNLALPQFPRGRYEVHYSVYMFDAVGSATSPTIAACYLRELGGPGYAAYSATTSAGKYVGLSGSDVLAKRSDRWILRCNARQAAGGADDWSIGEQLPVRVWLTRIDTTIGGSLEITRTRTDAR
jgi:hypothetical protein